MPPDPITLERVRRFLSVRSDVVEKPIIRGGRGFMVGGYLCCGVSARGLTVGVGAEANRSGTGRALGLSRLLPRIARFHRR